MAIQMPNNGWPYHASPYMSQRTAEAAKDVPWAINDIRGYDSTIRKDLQNYRAPFVPLPEQVPYAYWQNEKKQQMGGRKRGRAAALLKKMKSGKMATWGRTRLVPKFKKIKNLFKRGTRVQRTGGMLRPPGGVEPERDIPGTDRAGGAIGLASLGKMFGKGRGKGRSGRSGRSGRAGPIGAMMGPLQHVAKSKQRRKTLKALEKVRGRRFDKIKSFLGSRKQARHSGYRRGGCNSCQLGGGCSSCDSDKKSCKSCNRPGCTFCNMEQKGGSDDSVPYPEMPDVGIIGDHDPHDTWAQKGNRITQEGAGKIDSFLQTVADTPKGFKNISKNLVGHLGTKNFSLPKVMTFIKESKRGFSSKVCRNILASVVEKPLNFGDKQTVHEALCRALAVKNATMSKSKAKKTKRAEQVGAGQAGGRRRRGRGRGKAFFKNMFQKAKNSGLAKRAMSWGKKKFGDFARKGIGAVGDKAKNYLGRGGFGYSRPGGYSRAGGRLGISAVPYMSSQVGGTHHGGWTIVSGGIATPYPQDTSGIWNSLGY